MGVFYYEEKELPEYTTDNASNVLKVSADGVYLEWLKETSELPSNIIANSTTFNVGVTGSNGANQVTLNQTGASNFNTFTPDYAGILLPLTSTGISAGSNFLFGADVNESNGVFIMCSTVTTAGQPRLYVSGISGSANYLTTFTTITDSVLTGSNNWRSVAFGNNVWAVASHNAGGRTLFYTNNALGTGGWTQVANTAPWTTSRTIIKLKFINGQFVVLYAGSIIRVSTDCVTWSEITINATSYALQDIEYSPELRRYVIATRSLGFLYYDGTSLPTTGSNMFTFVSVTNGTTNAIAWSSKLGMFLSRDASGLYTYSRDGANWAQYTSTTLGTYNFTSPIRWINDFGGMFIDVVFQATNNCVVSRDGFNWVSVPLTMTNVANFFAYNRTNKHFLFTGTGTAFFKNVSTLFSSYIDPDLTYNTFNTNLKLRDNIEYEPQVITTAVGNTHVTTSVFNRSIVSFNTTSANANIYLQGASFNGRIGSKFTIVKTVSNANGVRIHAYEACRIVTPSANILNFNILTVPQLYDLIPSGFFGSFDLIRVNDETDGIYTGTWLVENLDVYPLLGGRREVGNLSVGGNLSVDGTISLASTTFSGPITLAENVGAGKSYELRFMNTAASIDGYGSAGISQMNINLNSTNIVNMTTSNFYVRNSLWVDRGIINTILVLQTPNSTHTVSRLTAPTVILGKPSTGTDPVRIWFPISTDVPDGFQVRIIVWDLPNNTGTGAKNLYFAGSTSSDNAFLLKQSGSAVLNHSTNYALLEGTIIDVINNRTALGRWMVMASSWIV